MTQQAAPAGLGRVALLGTGLIGGSFAAALKRHGLAARIVGCSDGDARQAQALGLVDEVVDDPGLAVAGCDTVVLAAPVSANCGLIARIAPFLPAGVLLTDVSSVKMPVVTAAVRHLGAALPGFIPCHPIAGSERSGPQAADAELFQGRTVILSPLPGSEAGKAAHLAAIWRQLGAVVIRLDAAEHDRIYGLVSHWPHALAFALAAAVAGDGVPRDLVGPGLLDLTRTAASSPELWADILLQNADPVLAAADQVGRQIGLIEAALRRHDREALVRLFGAAADWRRKLNQPPLGLRPYPP
jgi:prephenate dehydrogenase